MVQNHAEEKLIVGAPAVEEIPIGVSIDGKTIPPARVLELAEQHFVNEVSDAHGAIGHEWLSMLPAMGTILYAAGKGALTLSPAPLVESWGSATALGLSTPILYSLYKTEAAAKKDLRRVQRLSRNFAKTQDPKVLHAMQFQLEGYEDKNPEQKSFEHDDCPESDVTTAHLSQAANRIVVSKSECVSRFDKVKSFGNHVAHDVSDVLRSPLSFVKDIGAGWGSIGRQTSLLAKHVDATCGQKVWHTRQRVLDKISSSVSSKVGAAAFNEAANENVPALSDDELKAKKSFEHEASRLEKARGALVSSMAWSGPSFMLENGFVTVEAVNGISYLNQGDTQGVVMGLSHLFSAAMGLRPAQVLAQKNTYSVNNYTSPRSKAARMTPVEPEL